MPASTVTASSSFGSILRRVLGLAWRLLRGVAGWSWRHTRCVLLVAEVGFLTRLVPNGRSAAVRLLVAGWLAPALVAAVWGTCWPVSYHRLVAGPAEHVAYDAVTDGCFPLITNDTEMTEAQVLAAYHYQPNLERRHHLLKGEQHVAPVFLQHAHQRPCNATLPTPWGKQFRQIGRPSRDTAAGCSGDRAVGGPVHCGPGRRSWSATRRSRVPWTGCRAGRGCRAAWSVVTSRVPAWSRRSGRGQGS